MYNFNANQPTKNRQLYSRRFLTISPCDWQATGSPVVGSTPARSICSVTNCSRASSNVHDIRRMTASTCRVLFPGGSCKLVFGLSPPPTSVLTQTCTEVDTHTEYHTDVLLQCNSWRMCMRRLPSFLQQFLLSTTTLHHARTCRRVSETMSRPRHPEIPYSCTQTYGRRT